MIRNSNKGLDVSKEKIEIKRYCSDDISKVYSENGILSREFQVADLSSPDKLNIHVRSYVDFYGGYAEHGRNVVFGLENSGQCIVKLTPIKSLIDVDPFLMLKCTHLINNPAFDIKKSIFLTIAGPGWGQDKFLPRNDRYSILWTMIESLDCHPMMYDWLENCNEIWAPTLVDAHRFSKLDLKNLDTITNRVKIMRLGYDENLYNPQTKPINIVNLNGRFVFGVLGSWNKRKGIKKIIRAFCRAFSSKDPVSLLLVSKYATRPYVGVKDLENVTPNDKEKWDINYEFNRYTKDLDDIPHVSLIDVPIHENTIPNILARFDCLVGFSMGESTWLPGLQAMAMKKPVIQLYSKCSGFIDYMNDRNSYLCREVDYVKANDELVKGTSEYYDDQEFADGNEHELVEKMKLVYEQRNSDFERIICENAHLSVRDYTWKNSINEVINRLKEIKNAY